MKILLQPSITNTNFLSKANKSSKSFPSFGSDSQDKNDKSNKQTADFLMAYYNLKNPHSIIVDNLSIKPVIKLDYEYVYMRPKSYYEKFVKESKDVYKKYSDDYNIKHKQKELLYSKYKNLIDTFNENVAKQDDLKYEINQMEMKIFRNKLTYDQTSYFDEDGKLLYKKACKPADEEGKIKWVEDENGNIILKCFYEDIKNKTQIYQHSEFYKNHSNDCTPVAKEKNMYTDVYSPKNGKKIFRINDDASIMSFKNVGRMGDEGITIYKFPDETLNIWHHKIYNDGIEFTYHTDIYENLNKLKSFDDKEKRYEYSKDGKLTKVRILSDLDGSLKGKYLTEEIFFDENEEPIKKNVYVNRNKFNTCHDYDFNYGLKLDPKTANPIEINRDDRRIILKSPFEIASIELERSYLKYNTKFIKTDDGFTIVDKTLLIGSDEEIVELYECKIVNGEKKVSKTLTKIKNGKVTSKTNEEITKEIDIDQLNSSLLRQYTDLF